MRWSISAIVDAVCLEGALRNIRITVGISFLPVVERLINVLFVR